MSLFVFTKFLSIFHNSISSASDPPLLWIVFRLLNQSKLFILRPKIAKMGNLTYPVQEVVINDTINTTAPIPKYSHTTLLFTFPLKIWVVRPKITYIADESDKDQIVVGIGQNEKLIASSPKTKAKIKLWIIFAVVTLSCISIDQRICKIKGKVTKNTTNPFHKNKSSKAKITLKIKKADKSVNRKLAVEAALYKGIVLIDATLNTFWDNSKR